MDNWNQCAALFYRVPSRKTEADLREGKSLRLSYKSNATLAVLREKFKVSIFFTAVIHLALQHEKKDDVAVVYMADKFF
ncbi:MULTISPECIES: hypothetical protein [unclassified Bartonella]|uniref:hypothetical protein n=1 Tax=unclassified Bartonella TaxID=2645622 RepID=UPI00300E3D6A